MRIKGRYPQWNYWMAMTFMAPVPWEADAFYAQPGMAAASLTLDTWPVGTGPFMETEYFKDRRQVMSRNPNYRGEPYPCEGMPGDKEEGLLDDCGKKTPFVDKIVVTAEREKVPQKAKFLQGYYDLEVFERTDLGMEYIVAKQDSEDIRKEYDAKGFRLDRFDDVWKYNIGFNMLDPVIGKGDTPEQQERNRKLREAMNIAIDWEEFSKVFPNHAGATAQGPLPNGIFGSRQSTPEGVNPYTHRLVDGLPVRRSIEDAKKLMVEAGYPEGRDVRTGRPLVVNYDYYALPTPERKVEIDWMVRQFAKIDIQLEVRATDNNQFQDKVRKGKHQVFWYRLECRLSGRRELPVPVLRPECEERVGRRERRQLPEPRVRQAVRADEDARRRPGQAGADRPDDQDPRGRRPGELRLSSRTRRPPCSTGSTTRSRPS